ncbi:MAG: hypothetical protein AAB930_00310 [Patescibacteria group bacterium]
MQFYTGSSPFAILNRSTIAALLMGLESPFAPPATLFDELLSKSQYFSKSEIENLQMRRISSLLKYARLSPFYESLMENVKSARDFEKLPPMDKPGIRLAVEQGRITNKKLLYRGLPQRTSGSTGIPLNFFMDKFALPRYAARYRRMLNWTGKKEDDVVILLMPRPHPGLEQENKFIKCGTPEGVTAILEQLYALSDKRHIIVQSRTSHLLRLAQLIEQNRKRIKFRGLISYTEQLFPEMRQYMERIFDAPVFDYYACNEITGIGFECQYKNGFHVQSEFIYLEIGDENNLPVIPGTEGSVLVTSLDNKIMPFIRYRLGDIASWVDEQCKCGRTLPLIKISGRTVGTFLRPDGTPGFFYDLIWPIAIKTHVIRRYHVVRHSPAKYEVSVVPTESFKDKDAEFIKQRFYDYLGKIDLEFSLVDNIKEGDGKLYGFKNLFKD